MADGGFGTEGDLLTFGIIVLATLAALIVAIARMARRRPPPPSL
jgi:hypothetical protein